MTVQGWVYLAGALVLVRVFAGVFYRDSPTEPFNAVLLGMVGAIIWPAVLAGWALYRFCTDHPDAARRVFFHEPRRARLERRRDRLARRVADLERDLEL